MFCHFYLWIQEGRLGQRWGVPSVYFINELGAGSVSLFFMITGLVFYPKVLAGYKSTYWSTVYIFRLFRIVPLIVVSVGIVTGLIMFRTGEIIDIRSISSAAKWISGWSEPDILGYPDSGRINAYVLWSIWYEWLFYLLLLPACARVMDIVRGIRLPTYVLPITLFGILLATRVAAWLSGLKIPLLLYLPQFAVGMLAFECQSRAVIREIMSKPWIKLLAIFGIILAMTFAKFPYGLAIPLFALFFISVSCGNSVFGLLKTRGALIIGECSYGVYLFHGILLSVLFFDVGVLVASVPTIVLPILVIGVAVSLVLLTSVTYLLIERPAIRLGKSVAHVLIKRRAADPATRSIPGANSPHR
jgi:peptidoglycan/LPS O-acetylase OafA/YrhL